MLQLWAVGILVFAAAVTGEEVCCGDLGCYSSTGDFHDLVYRPLSSVPICALKSTIVLRLNTVYNALATQVLDPYDSNSIRASHFKPDKLTKILIHGFIDKYNRPAWEKAKSALLDDGDHNVIRVDWSHANIPPYVQACANLRLVGAYVAKFVDHLVREHGVKASNVHIIGHSLGAHGAGYAGQILRTQYNTTLGRITGLDPAGPYFSYLPTTVRLDPSDAAVVDTLVTNGEQLLAFGSPQSMGHINFFPNGGRNQPGCHKGIIPSMVRDVLEMLPIQLSAPRVQRSVNLRRSSSMQQGVSNTDTGTDGQQQQQQQQQQHQLQQQQQRRMDTPSVIVVPTGPRSLPDPLHLVAPSVPQAISGFHLFTVKTPFDYFVDWVNLQSGGGDGRSGPASRTFIADSFDLVGCSHNRAVLLWAEILLGQSCFMNARQCSNYETFIGTSGECSSCNGTNHACSPMGYRANLTLAEPDKVKDFFTRTTAKTPFCTNIKVQFTLQDNREETKVGQVFMTLQDAAGLTEKLTLTPDAVDLVAGKTYTYTPELTKDLGPIKNIIFRWEVKSNSAAPGSSRTQDWTKKDYITLDRNVLLTDLDETTHVFVPATSKIEAAKDVTVRWTESYEV